jgi:hypothetical protein
MLISDVNHKQELNAKNVLNLISEEDIYKQYLPDNFKFRTAFSSPFREDKHASFIIGGVERNYRYKDFATGEVGNCFNFVMNLYKLDFNQALIQIIEDFNISHNFIYSSPYAIQNKIQAKYLNYKSNSLNLGSTSLLIKSREFNEEDLKYWKSYGISLEYLKKGRIVAISHYFINNVMYIAEKYAYAYIEYKDNVITYKVYQPYSKYKKWINNNNFSVWELWHMLPTSGDVLIITSSRKDALSIIENLNIPATSFQAESVMPKDNVMKDIFNRFTKVYLLYDNDYNKTENWGQKLASKLLEKYNNLNNIIIDDEYKSTDFTDLYFNHGELKAIKIIKDKII